MRPSKNESVANGSLFWGGALKTLAKGVELTFDWVD
jgi:hypothetical protein